jgi:virginiamycin B lyase
VWGDGVTTPPHVRAVRCGAVVLAAALVGCSASGSSSEQGSANTDVGLERLRVVATIRLPGRPNLLTSAGGKLWVSFTDTGSVAAVDPRTNRIGRPIRLAQGMATSYEIPIVGDKRTLWAVDSATERLYRVDPRTRKVEPALNVDGPIGAALAFGSLWIAEFHPYKVVRVDPDTLRIVARVSASGPTDVEAGAGSIWVLAHHTDEVLRIDPATNRVAATIPLIGEEPNPQRMAFAEGAVWVVDPSAQSVTRVSAARNRATVEVKIPRADPPWPFAVSSGGGYVWVCGEWEVFRVNPRTNGVTGAVRLAPATGEEGPLGNVYYAFGSVWAVDSVNRKLFRIAPGSRQ